MSDTKEKKKEKRVKCYFCKKWIHIDRFGGVFNPKGKPEMFCDRLPCIMKLSDWQKKNKK